MVWINLAYDYGLDMILREGHFGTLTGIFIRYIPSIFHRFTVAFLAFNVELPEGLCLREWLAFAVYACYGSK